ncbi:hypothetical protein GGF44_004972 [Coemansia sp. RSA 1694]|nr:hypothetical protein GGF44_004972 [Coemansia sp. RSA 1694]
MVVSPHSPSPSPAVSNHYQPHVSSSSSLGSAYNTYGPAPPPPPPQQPTIVVAQEQVTVYTNGSTVATDESLHADLATTVASETAATASSEPSASEGSEPARPDSAAADIDNNTPFVDAVEHSTDAVEPSNRDPEPEIVRPAPAPAALPPPSPPAVVATAVVVEQQPVQQSSTTAAAASNTSNESDVPAVSAGRHSPPPNYDELLPPEYEVPANQPPPYRPLESNRSRRRMWDI